MLENDPLYRQALEAYERDQFDRAAEAFERFLALHPDHVQARYKLANVRKEQGRWQSAVSHYEAVLKLQPSHAEALNNLGAVYQTLGRWSEAESCYRKSLQLKAELAQPYMNLGRLLQSQGRASEAQSLYQAALDRGLDRGLFGHLLTASSGGAATKAPENYVRETFDAFAGQFDRHLVEELAYQVPQQLAAMAKAHAGSRSLDVLDLGCGTGLLGEALVPLCRYLVGVDLSARMLQAARRRGRYHELHEQELEQWLDAAPQRRFDMVLAADVFIYIGALEKVFTGVARVLRPAGALAFSVESCEGSDWQLLPSGRYAQSNSYLVRLAAQHGFRMESRQAVTIRRGVPGELYLLIRD